MNSTLKLLPGLALAISLLLAAARAEDTLNTIAFSNPSKPGTLKISLGRGDVTIHGADTKDVVIKSDSSVASNKPRKDNLRVLSSVSSFALSEKDNVITLDAAAVDLGRNSNDCEITVPRATTIIIQNVGGGDIECSGITGDIDINSMRGDIELNDVSGGVVAGIINGDINVNVRELREGKPLSLTAMKGDVTIRLPETTKASLRFRTHNGEVLAEFDEKALITKTESNTGALRAHSKFVYKGADGKKMSTSASSSSQSSGSSSSSNSSSNTNRDDEPESRSSRSERGSQVAPSKLDDKTPESASSDKPSISGGKLVTGTLNGGGTEISVSTMSGDIVIRKTATEK